MADVETTKLCSELYDILGACNNEELAPIVDMLTKAQVSVLKISRAFERHHPEHVLYTDQIGDEMYRLSLEALGRGGGSRPTYGAIVNGLCKRIGIPVSSNDTEATETLLLNTFSRQHLSTLSSAERQLVVIDACAAASDAAAGMLSSDAWRLVASTIMQVAYLRKKLAGEGRPHTKPGDEQAAGGVPALVDDGAGALIVQTENGDPILSVAYLREVDAAGWRGIDGGSKAMHMLTPILKAVQPLVAADELLKAGNYMRVTVPRGANLVHSDKLGHLIGMAKDQKGSFKSIRLDPASVAKLASPAALLALANAMAEQQKLEEIERSLAEIKAVLGEVSRFQRDERRSVLTGSIRYFNQVAPAVLAGELGSEVLHEIERHEAELVRIQEHLAEELRGQVSALLAVKKEGWGSTTKYVKAIEDAQAAFDKACAELSLCIRARACGYQLLCFYPGRETGKRARLEDIGGALSAFSVAGEAVVSMDQVLREKMKGVSSYETKALLLNNENVLFDRLAVEGATILGGLEKAQRGLLDQAEPISIELRIQDGEAVAMRML